MTIKQCPFCNGSPRVMVREQRFLGQYENGTKVKQLAFYVKCNRCHSRGGVFTLITDNTKDELGIEYAIENWNLRVEAST